MKELFYFSFADLMTRVEYQQEANALRYVTHRKMTISERVMIEQYLLATFAVKTDYYKRQPAHFVCLGTDKQLVKALDDFHSKNILCEIGEQEVEDSVTGIISQSMQNYYFEQIGDTILEARRETVNLKAGFAEERRGKRKVRLQELVKAYNVYADPKITMDEIIPSALKPYFGISRKAAYHSKGSTDMPAGFPAR